jgi:hypothetical protein
MSPPTTRSRFLARSPRKCHIPKAHLIALISILALCSLPFLVGAFAGVTPSSTTDSNQRRSELARLSDSISVHAAGRGNPTINLSDGHDVLTSYLGPEQLRVALERNQAEPLSLAAADFDEDGVPDLVSGYSYNGRGIVSLLRGNVDSIYPNSLEAQHRRASGTFTQAPFLSPARVFEAPIAADFVGAGDFDGDSHWDVVVGSRSSSTLNLLSGDGHGGLLSAREIELPGVVTAFTTGEINRRDGLTDVVVGLDGPGGPKVLVFEGPEGALRSEPEILSMPAVVSCLALGQLNNDPIMDLAVAAGAELMVVLGRDRMLSLDERLQATVGPARIEKETQATNIKALAIRELAGDQGSDLAMLLEDGTVATTWPAHKKDQSRTRGLQAKWPRETVSEIRWPGATQLVAARLSSKAAADLLVVDSVNHQIHILSSDLQSLDLEGEPVSVLSMRLNSDALSDLVMLSRNVSSPSVTPTSFRSVFTVTNTNDSGPGSLRQAISEADANLGADAIVFSINSGLQVISPSSPLPLITEAVTIDGTTQPGFLGVPIIELNGINMGAVDPSVHGLEILLGNSAVRGLVVNRFQTLDSILIFGAGHNVIEGNYIGTNAAGTDGFCSDFATCQFRGGIAVSNSANNVIGGTTASARNVISGSGGFGGEVTISGSGPGNQIIGNFIGTNASGSGRLASGGDYGVYGIQTLAAIGTIIGGTTPGARNIISNGGIAGIFVLDSNSVSPPGTTGGNLIQGNYIGIDVTGAGAISPTSGTGIELRGQDRALRSVSGNTVGGTTSGARNIISGNTRFDSSTGVGIGGIFTTPNLVQGNYIGTDFTGAISVANHDGVGVAQAQGTVIGGSIVMARNIISGNLRYGVAIGSFKEFLGGSGVIVQGNYIGTNVTGNACLGNGGDGIYVEVTSVTHTIKDNLIACNGSNGIKIPNISDDPNHVGNPAFQINIDSNLLYSNNALGVDLGTAGITPNDAGDADAGANLLQNFPVLTSVSSSAPSSAGASRLHSPAEPVLPFGSDASLNVNGTLNSTPNSTFTVQWYFSVDSQCTNNQASSRPLVFDRVPNVMTDANGNASFSFPFTFPVGIDSGIINCTATDANGNTSEFSSCLPVMAPPKTLQFS